ncbi:MAG: PAS domain S-box protein [Nitrospinae bacterium]|nr:PAS domain S-box protein [Nitrospinota bacterium]
MKLGTVPDWAPLCFRGNKGELSGIAGAYKNLIEKKLSISFSLIPDAPWDEVLDNIKHRKTDVVMLLGQTPARDNYMVFSEILLELPYVIITRTDAPHVSGVSRLAGNRVSVRNRFVSHEWLAAEHPEIALFPKKSTIEALQAVSSGEVDAYVGSLADASLATSQAGLANLKIAASADFTNRLRIGVRKDWPELVPILNKTIATIPGAEHHEIWDRWIHLKQPGIDPRTLYGLAVAFIVAAFIGLVIHNLRLRNAYSGINEKVRERTKDLEGLNRELKESQARYHEIFEQVTDYILVLDPAQDPPVIIDASESAFRIHGYTRGEMVGRPITMIDVEGAKVPGRMDEILLKNPLQFEVLHRRKDGSTFRAEVLAKLINVSGKQLMYTVEHDITEKKKAEVILQSRADLSDLAVKSSLDQLIQSALDLAERQTFSQIGYFHFVDDDQENLTLQTWSTNTLQNMCKAEGKGMHYPVSKAGVWVDCFHAKKPVIHNDYAGLPHKKGLPEGHAPVIRELGVPVLQGDKVVAILGVGNKETDYNQDDVEVAFQIASILFDLVERKRAEEALAKESARLHTLLETASDGIHVMDEKGNIVQFSQSFAQMLGYSREETTRLNMADWEARIPREELPEKIQALIRRPATYETKHRRKDGTEFDVEINATGVVLDGKTYLYASSRDITERKRGERSLRTAKETAENATQLKDKFVSLVAHDLKSPLTIMTGFLKLIRLNSSDTLNDNQRQILDRAIDAGRQMTSLIEDILSLSRLRTGAVKLNMEFFDARQLGKKIAADYYHAARDKGIELMSDIPEHSRIYSDKTLFSEVINNFVTNAVKFCGKGDRITISMATNGGATVFVSDTGPGMEPSIAERLLSREESVSARGTAGETGSGFGLMIAKEVIKTLGGEFLMESAVGKGSRFGVRVPAVRPLILLVDDDPAFRFLLMQYLNMIDVAIVEADDGETAMKFISESENMPHVVISDIEMPKISGLELLAYIQSRHETRGIPVIIVSGKHGMEIRDEVYGLGAKEYLTKLIDPDDFIPRMRRYIS